jgi:hypothetical protein
MESRSRRCSRTQQQGPMMTDHSLPPADTLPAAMVTRPQWLCWRAEERDGKPTPD